MSPSLLENLRSIPDHRRAEGKRFDWATVSCGTRSSAWSPEPIRIGKCMNSFAFIVDVSNEAFGSLLPLCAVLYWLVDHLLQGVDPNALETAFGPLAMISITSAAVADGQMVGHRRPRENAAREFPCPSRQEGGAHAFGIAPLRPDRPWPSDGRGEEQRDTDGPGTDRGAPAEGLRVHALYAEHALKNGLKRVIASGSHLLTQVKDNQPTLRRELELGPRVASRAAMPSKKSRRAAIVGRPAN